MWATRKEMHEWLDDILDKSKHDRGTLNAEDFENNLFEIKLYGILSNLMDMHKNDFSDDLYTPHGYVYGLADQIELVNRTFLFRRIRDEISDAHPKSCD